MGSDPTVRDDQPKDTAEPLLTTGTALLHVLPKGFHRIRHFTQ